MSDYNFITERLATGAAISGPADVAALVAAGVTDVIDCRAEFDDTAEFASNPQVAGLRDGTQDDGQARPPQWVNKPCCAAGGNECAQVKLVGSVRLRHRAIPSAPSGAFGKIDASSVPCRP
jgi:hypothetical protein